jgi:hypothetical protein
MGRKKLFIDWKVVDNLLKSQCDGAIIARMIGISPDTLYKRCKAKFKVDFSAYSQQKKSEGRELLKAKQYELAMNGDRTMLVWLGKQHLGQKEKMDHTSNDKDLNPRITIEVINSKDQVKQDDPGS